MKTKTFLAAGLMFLAALSFSLMGAAVKYVSPGIPYMQSVFWRGSISVLLIAPWMLRNKISFWGKQRIFLLNRSLLGFAAISCSFFAATKIDLASASVLTLTSVIFVPVLAVSILHEKVTSDLMRWIAFAFVGVLLVVKPGVNTLTWPALVGLSSGFFSACAHVAVRKLNATEAAETIVFNFCFYSAVCSLFLSLKTFMLPDMHTLYALFLMGFAGACGQLFMTHAYRLAPAAWVSPFSFSGVVFSAVWGALLWSEFPDALSILGSVLIFFGSYKLLRLKAEVAPVYPA